MEYIEFSEKTVNDAITKACEHFQVPSNHLVYEVVDQGSNGFLGIGARNAKIRAYAKTEEDIEREEKEKAEQEKAELEKKARIEEAKESASSALAQDSSADDSNNTVSDAESAADLEEEYGFSSEPRHEKRRERRGDRKSRSDSNKKSRGSRDSYQSSKRSNAVFDNVDEFNGIKAFLNEMFTTMKMEVSVELKYAKEEKILDIDLSGPSMGILIGKRGQTLDAIQYLSSLVVNKSGEEYVHVKVDTENYRKRRKDTLENLAKNISFKVKRSRKPVSLEPMNPYERRIIHSSLQNDRYVTTYSEGQEPYRRVVVAPKAHT